MKNLPNKPLRLFIVFIIMLVAFAVSHIKVHVDHSKMATITVHIADGYYMTSVCLPGCEQYPVPGDGGAR